MKSCSNRWGSWAILGGACLVAACSPVFNWRDAQVGSALTALLPCKPDRAMRTLALADGGKITLNMTGCGAGDATFAIAEADADNAAQAGQWLAAWQAATRAQWLGARLTETAAAVPGAATSPGAVRLEIAGGAAPGRPSQAQLVWFARATGSGRVALFQAMVLGKPSEVEAVSTFFEGLRLH